MNRFLLFALTLACLTCVASAFSLVPHIPSPTELIMDWIKSKLGLGGSPASELVPSISDDDTSIPDVPLDSPL